AQTSARRARAPIRLFLAAGTFASWFSFVRWASVLMTSARKGGAESRGPGSAPPVAHQPGGVEHAPGQAQRRRSALVRPAAQIASHARTNGRRCRPRAGAYLVVGGDQRSRQAPRQCDLSPPPNPWASVIFFVPMRRSLPR